MMSLLSVSKTPLKHKATTSSKSIPKLRIIAESFKILSKILLLSILLPCFDFDMLHFVSY